MITFLCSITKALAKAVVPGVEAVNNELFKAFYKGRTME